MAQRLRFRAPGERGKAEFADAVEHRRGDALGRGRRQRLVLQHQGEEPLLAARQHRLLAAVPGDGIDGLDRRGEILLDVGARQRGGEEDAGDAPLAIELGHGKELLGGERIGRRQLGATPVGEPELAGRPRSALGDAVGIGERQHPARGIGRGRRRVAQAKLALELPRGLAHALGGAAVEGEVRPELARGCAIAQQLQPQPEIGIAPARRRLDDVALRQQRRDLGGEPALAALARRRSAIWASRG